MNQWMRKVLVTGLLVGGTAACTFISNETSTQCRSQEDCLSRGPEFADTTCTAERVCQKIAAPERACLHNQECIDRNGGAPYTCRQSDGKCVSLLSTNCQTLYANREDLLDDNLVVIGAPVPFDENGRQAGFAADLARQEIRRFGGLAAATPEGPRRPLAIVSCVGEHQSTAASQAMFSHFADTLRVPFVAGPFTSQQTVAGMNLFISRGILSMTQNSLIDVTSLADNDLSYRINFSDALQIKAMNTFISSYLEGAIRNDTYCAEHPVPGPPPVTGGAACVPFNIGPTDPIRIALLVTDDQPGAGITQSVNESIRFNGKSAVENLADGNFAIFKVGNPADPIGHPTPEAERNTGITQAIAFKPHFIMYGGTPIDANVLGGDMGWLALNRLWPKDQPRPYGAMLVQAWAATIMPLIGQSMAPAAGLGFEPRQKYFGVRGLAYGFDPADFGRWVNLLKTTFPDLSAATVTPLASMSYSRVFLFAYATAAIGNAPLQGTELARGLRRVSGQGSGLAINWDVNNYSQALAELAAGRNISYVAPDGQVSFDERGDRPGFSEVYCVPLRNGALAGPQSSGFSYDPATNQPKGGYTNCVDN